MVYCVVRKNVMDKEAVLVTKSKTSHASVNFSLIPRLFVNFAFQDILEVSVICVLLVM